MSKEHTCELVEDTRKMSHLTATPAVFQSPTILAAPRIAPSATVTPFTAHMWRPGGSAAGRGAAPQLWTAHPRGHPHNIPIRASKGMTCPNLRVIGSGRGRGFSLVVFPTALLLV